LTSLASTIRPTKNFAMLGLTIKTYKSDDYDGSRK
jgi:hypothetical protein